MLTKTAENVLVHESDLMQSKAVVVYSAGRLGNASGLRPVREWVGGFPRWWSEVSAVWTRTCITAGGQGMGGHTMATNGSGGELSAMVGMR